MTLLGPKDLAEKVRLEEREHVEAGRLYGVTIDPQSQRALNRQDGKVGAVDVKLTVWLPLPTANDCCT